MSEKTRDWWVYSTFREPFPGIMVQDRNSADLGYIRDFAPREWTDSYHAPSSHYRWNGGDERVIVNPGQAPPFTDEEMDAIRARSGGQCEGVVTEAADA